MGPGSRSRMFRAFAIILVKTHLDRCFHFIYFLYFFFLVLGLEPGALGMQGVSVASELHSTCLRFVLLFCCGSVFVCLFVETGPN